MEWGELAEQLSQHFLASWLRILMRELPDLPLRLAAKHRPSQQPVATSEPITSAFNICCIVTFDDGFKAVVRMPILGRSRFRVEKTNDELLTMGYITPRTQIPMGACGPYIVMAFVEGVLFSKSLRDPAIPSPSLDPSVSDSDLGRAYPGMAGIILEMYKLPFPRIGAICHVPGSWKGQSAHYLST